MSDALTFRKHIFGHAISAWGHNKPLITLAVLVAEMRSDVAFTILTNSAMYPKIMGELGKLPRERLKPIEMQINVLQVIPPHPDPFYPAVELGIEFKKLYEQNGVVTCLASGKTIDCAYFPRPCVAIIDPFADYALKGIRACASPEEVPIISWMTGPAGPLLAMWGPEKYGGKGDVVSKLREEMEKSGKNELEAFYSENVFGTTDELSQIPGFPPFYDYERITQPLTEEFKGLNMHVTINGAQFVANTEGIISISSSVLEKEAIEACRDWFSTMGKSFFAIGHIPTIPAPTKVEDNDNQSNTTRVMSFLNEMKSRFGDKSVLYISFGTFFWPPDGATFRVLIEELVKTKMPFILAHPSPLFRPDESLLEAIRACPTAIETTWAPQERILTHEATGWFLTHGGWNSTQEALLYKVPLIMWPMGADQPINALLLSEKFKAAFELLEVRDSSNTRRPYRLKDQPKPESPEEEFKRVLSDIKGEKGSVVRRNLEGLSQKIGGVWREDGEARRELEAFLKRYVD